MASAKQNRKTGQTNGGKISKESNETSKRQETQQASAPRTGKAIRAVAVAPTKPAIRLPI